MRRDRRQVNRGPSSAGEGLTSATGKFVGSFGKRELSTKTEELAGGAFGGGGLLVRRDGPSNEWVLRSFLKKVRETHRNFWGRRGVDLLNINNFFLLSILLNCFFLRRSSRNKLPIDHRKINVHPLKSDGQVRVEQFHLIQAAIPRPINLVLRPQNSGPMIILGNFKSPSQIIYLLLTFRQQVQMLFRLLASSSKPDILDQYNSILATAVSFSSFSLSRSEGPRAMLTNELLKSGTIVRTRHPITDQRSSIVLAPVKRLVARTNQIIIKFRIGSLLRGVTGPRLLRSRGANLSLFPFGGSVGRPPTSRTLGSGRLSRRNMNDRPIFFLWRKDLLGNILDQNLSVGRVILRDWWNTLRRHVGGSSTPLGLFMLGGGQNASNVLLARTWH
ncbi:uncharacterized protein G2W53_014076 [Senna tora]|uniref:Uncharacterized protein n=1 Tax=Senna tora TaxID=362788 RepID=A0A834TZU7_9FABA|nr:uncharacterized protein G2W53_014076 [Senna tora]